MNKAGWDGPAGQAIKGELTSEVPGLPQAEPAFKISYVIPDHFKGLLTYVRNILIVEVDPSIYTKVSLSVERNRWANNQVVMTLKAPSNEDITEYIKEHPRTIVDYFNQVERDRTLAQLTKNHSQIVEDLARKNFDVTLYVPTDMTYYRDTTGFLWTSNNAGTGRSDIVIYDFPYTDANTFTEEFLVNMRDSVMKANMPGTYPGSYMKTNKDRITYTPTTIDGEYAGVLRGLWEMEGDMMGGPFVSHARLDKKNNRIVVVEGFVYAPETDKRNFMRRTESALHSLRFNNGASDDKKDAAQSSKEDK